MQSNLKQQNYSRPTAFLTVVIVTTAHQNDFGMEENSEPLVSISTKYTADEKRITPIKRKKISRPNSRIDALRVCPRICKPFECRESLKIRKTRTRRITLRMANDIPFPLAEVGGYFSVARLMKYGAIATMSIRFMRFFQNLIFCGLHRNLIIISKLNQQMQTVSITQNGSLKRPEA